MDNSSHPGSGSDNLEIHSHSTFRQLLGQHSAASRILGQNHAANERSSIQYVPAQTRDDADVDISSGQTPPEKRPPYHSYESVDTTNKSASSHDTRVLWQGLSAWALTWELLGIVISVLFLVLGTCVAHLKGQTESEWSKHVIQATRIAPSIWPILFSGVLGNAVRRFANWRAERGIRLLALEQLMSSLTMAGSILAVFTWSIFQFSSLIIVVLWAFNPLGSQASFRGIYLTDTIGHGVGKISYYNYNLTTQFSLSVFGVGGTRSKPMIRALYSSALYDVMSNTQYVDQNNASFKDAITKLGGSQAAGIQAATDSWGNLRIPSIEYLDTYNSAIPNEWVQVPWMDSLQNYSSLVGDRFDGLDRSFTGNTTFNMTSSYQNLDCSPWLRLGLNETETWAMSTFGQNFSAIMQTDLLRPDGVTMDDYVYRSFIGLSSVEAYRMNFSAPGHPKFIFASTPRRLETDVFLFVTECATGTTYVDLQVTCMSKGASGKADCGVDAIRKSLEPTEPPGAGILEALRFDNRTLAAPYDETVTRGFQAAFTDLIDDNQIGSGQSSFIERYITDPMTAFDGAVTMQYADLGSLDIKLVERRLSLIYNTLWKVGWSYKSMTGGNMTTSFNKSTVVDGFLEEQPVYLMNATSQTVQPLEPVYALDVPWLIVYFVSVGVMFFAAVASLLFHAKSHAPPILGYVSSLIRDSVFFSDTGVQGNSTEGGATKAKRLGEMEVKIADVWSDESTGRVAFAPAQGRGAVQKGRWYE